MEQENRVALIDIMEQLYKDPADIEEQWQKVTPLLTELSASSPDGFAGMTAMINRHFTNATKFKSAKIQQFELESGLLKLKIYFKKLDLLAEACL